jgi:acetoin utilization protein AcuA
MQGKEAEYYSILGKKESLIQAALEPDANVTLALKGKKEIIGLSILQYPDPDERWLRVGERIMMEVSVIEVCRRYRETGIAGTLLDALVKHPLEADRIFYMVGYSWTWDLDGKGISVADYRKMMIHLFSKYGFQVFKTNEPNILLRPENLFMARIGDSVSEDILRQFKKVRFNLDL